jgi:hypothetical protein
MGELHLQLIEIFYWPKKDFLVSQYAPPHSIPLSFSYMIFTDEFMSDVTQTLVQIYDALRGMGVKLPAKTQGEIDACAGQWVDKKLVHQHQENMLTTTSQVILTSILPFFYVLFYYLFLLFFIFLFIFYKHSTNKPCRTLE